MDIVPGLTYKCIVVLRKSTVFPGFRHICLSGFEEDPVSRAVSDGIVKYRGRTHKWLIHKIASGNEGLRCIGDIDTPCDLLVANFPDPISPERLAHVKAPILYTRGLSGLSGVRTHGFHYRAIGHLAGEYLRTKKFRHIGFMSNRIHPHTLEIWEGLFAQVRDQVDSLALIDRGEHAIQYRIPRTRREPLHKLYHWFPEMPRPYAILTDEDSTAATLAELAFFAGVSVPEELVILGIGNHKRLCQLAHPQLSSIELPSERLGWLIGEHIEAIFEDRDPAFDPQLLPPIGVIVRQSTELSAVEDALVAKALTLMRHDASSRKTIAEMVSRLPISKRSFNDRFLKAVGRTPREELFRIRFEMAKERLLETNQTVLHVALDCGFADAESMAAFFRKTIGMTPTEFRKQNRL